MNIFPIRNENDYKTALKAISKLVETDPPADSPQGEYLEVVSTLIQSYETKHFPIDAPDPITAIKFRMEQAGLEPKDLVPFIGKTNRVYEVLNGKRGLSIERIRNLRRNLGIPAESLIGV